VGRLTLTRRPPARHLTLLEPGHMTAGSTLHLLSPRARTPLRAVARPELAGLLVCCGLAVVEHLAAPAGGADDPGHVRLGLPVTVTALYTLALALSAWFASVAFRRYVRSYPAALLGGLVYGFSPAMIAQSSSHLHLTLGAVLPPLMLLAVDELLHRQRRNPLLVGAGLGFLTELLGRPPERVAGVWVWWRVQPWSLERWRDGQTPMVRAAV
jgi:hypothetical protein